MRWSSEVPPYTAVLTVGDDGWISAQVAEVPEAIRHGRTVGDAKENVAKALEAALAWRDDDGELLPPRAEVMLEEITLP